MADNGRKKGNAPLLAALAAGATVREAAKRAGVGERTAYRRLADPAYRRRVTEARAEMVSRALGKLADGAAEAVETLRALLRSDSDSARLGAARCILETGNRLRESVEMEQRLTDLEKRFQERTP
jgi:transposase